MPYSRTMHPLTSLQNDKIVLPSKKIATTMQLIKCASYRKMLSIFELFNIPNYVVGILGFRIHYFCAYE